MSRPAPNLLTIPASAPFLAVLADALLDGRLVEGFAPRNDPFALASATVFLPTRRAGRLLAEALRARMASGVTLLPRIVPLGDVDEDLLAFAESFTDPPRAVPGMTRRLALANLVRRWRRLLAGDDGRVAVAAGPGAEFALADALAHLIDEMAAQQVPWERLDTLVPGQHDLYWDMALDFLQIAREFWPALLDELGAVDASVRRDRLIAAEAERLQADARRPGDRRRLDRLHAGDRPPARGRRASHRWLRGAARPRHRSRRPLLGSPDRRGGAGAEPPAIWPRPAAESPYAGRPRRGAGARAAGAAWARKAALRGAAAGRLDRGLGEPRRAAGRGGDRRGAGGGERDRGGRRPRGGARHRRGAARGAGGAGPQRRPRHPRPRPRPPRRRGAAALRGRHRRFRRRAAVRERARPLRPAGGGCLRGRAGAGAALRAAAPSARPLRAGARGARHGRRRAGIDGAARPASGGGSGAGWSGRSRASRRRCITRAIRARGSTRTGRPSPPILRRGSRRRSARCWRWARASTPSRRCWRRIARPSRPRGAPRMAARPRTRSRWPSWRRSSTTWPRAPRRRR